MRMDSLKPYTRVVEMPSSIVNLNKKRNIVSTLKLKMKPNNAIFSALLILFMLDPLWHGFKFGKTIIMLFKTFYNNLFKTSCYSSHMYIFAKYLVANQI